MRSAGREDHGDPTTVQIEPLVPDEVLAQSTVNDAEATKGVSLLQPQLKLKQSSFTAD